MFPDNLNVEFDGFFFIIVICILLFVHTPNLRLILNILAFSLFLLFVLTPLKYIPPSSFLFIQRTYLPIYFFTIIQYSDIFKFLLDIGHCIACNLNLTLCTTSAEKASLSVTSMFIVNCQFLLSPCSNYFNSCIYYQLTNIIGRVLLCVFIYW